MDHMTRNSEEGENIRYLLYYNLNQSLRTLLCYNFTLNAVLSPRTVDPLTSEPARCRSRGCIRWST